MKKKGKPRKSKRAGVRVPCSKCGAERLVAFSDLDVPGKCRNCKSELPSAVRRRKHENENISKYKKRFI
jgi:predicted Zn-ribbon and HTH transcriptional regulator